jgi:hypothetical protein
MNIPPVIATHVCIHCGARSQSSDGKCWLCFEEKSVPNPYQSTKAATGNAAPPANTWDGVFTVLLGTCVVLTILIAIGMGVQDPGMLVPFAIFVGPAYLVTVIRALAQMNSERGPRPTSLFVTFMLSLLVTFAILILLMVAVIVLLFIACLQSASR